MNVLRVPQARQGDAVCLGFCAALRGRDRGVVRKTALPKLMLRMVVENSSYLQ